MGTVKKRVLRKGASNAEKIDDSVTKKSLHLPPGALQEILAEKKRKVTSKAGVVEDIIGGSKHDQDPQVHFCLTGRNQFVVMQRLLRL